MKLSKYLKKCLAELEANPEHESDVLLVHLVKVQYLTQQINDWVSREDEEDTAMQSLLHQAPVSAYLSAFEAEIQRLRNALPPNLKNHSAPLLVVNADDIIIAANMWALQDYYKYTSLRHPFAFINHHPSSWMLSSPSQSHRPSFRRVVIRHSTSFILRSRPYKVSLIAYSPCRHLIFP